MNKIIFLIILIIASIECIGQNRFKIGYFIDNKNVKTECFIKNYDWLRNPSQIKYKLFNNEEIREETIDNIKEFSIPGYCKFIRANVDIDVSSSGLKNISTDKNPIWQHKQLLLKVLVEGEANLYYYFGSKIDERFFYSCKDTVISQLIFKEYIYDSEHTAYNDTFRIQLKNNVRCSFSSDILLANMAYKKGDLIKYFIDYNTCKDSTYKVPERKINKGEFNVALSAGLAYSSLSISSDVKTFVNTDFDGKFSNTFSMDFEYILPFNNNKWGIVLSPAYQAYHSEKQNDFKSTYIDFKSIDLALGIKHYLYLNDNAKLFVDCFVNSLLNFSIDSEIGYKVNTTKDFTYLDMSEVYNSNFIFGIGFEYKRIFAELRYYTPQNLISRYPSWNSKYEKMSFSVGYKILKTRQK